MDTLVIAVLAGVAVFAAVLIWVQVQTAKLNKKRKAEGKEPVGIPPPVNVIDWTKK